MAYRLYSDRSIEAQLTAGLCFGSITELRNHIVQNSWCCARDLDREGIGERHFPETVEAARGAGVTGVKVGAKDNQIVVRAQEPQPRDPFRRFPVEHTRIG